MKKMILAVVTAIVATGALVADASARQNNRSEAHASTSGFRASKTYGYGSSDTGFFGLSSTGVQPIPGSITYGGQPKTRLLKAPVGSSFNHEFMSGASNYSETYIIQADRSLKLVSRSIRNQN